MSPWFDKSLHIHCICLSDASLLGLPAKSDKAKTGLRVFIRQGQESAYGSARQVDFSSLSQMCSEVHTVSLSEACGHSSNRLNQI